MINFIVPLLTGAVIPVFVTYLTRKWIFGENKKKKQKQIYSDLMGIKITLRQSVVSRFESQIFFQYYQQLYLLTKNEFTKIEFKRHLERSEQLVTDITHSLQKLFEQLGYVNAYYSQSNKLDQLVNELYEYKTPVIYDPKPDLTQDQLNEWKDKGQAELSRWVEENYATPINKLLNLLREEVKCT
ncbi:MAG: hypothetical protein ABIE74_07570 [Pseudomonadota bacterium]